MLIIHPPYIPYQDHPGSFLRILALPAAAAGVEDSRNLLDIALAQGGDEWLFRAHQPLQRALMAVWGAKALNQRRRARADVRPALETARAKLRRAMPQAGEPITNAPLVNEREEDAEYLLTFQTFLDALDRLLDVRTGGGQELTVKGERGEAATEGLYLTVASAILRGSFPDARTGELNRVLLHHACGWPEYCALFTNGARDAMKKRRRDMEARLKKLTPIPPRDPLIHYFDQPSPGIYKPRNWPRIEQDPIQEVANILAARGWWPFIGA